MKVVINDCFGGFNLSTEAVKLGRKLSKDNKWAGVVLPGEKYEDGTVLKSFLGDMNSINYDHPRHDPVLVEVVETLGSEKSSGKCAKLKIVEIPDDIEYEIDEYDGLESIHETHRSWS